MKINELLQHTIQQLEAAGVPTARLDCLVIFEDVLNTNRTQILAHPEREITEVEHQQIVKLVDKRAQHIPLAYIRGKTEFYGRTFTINQHVLVPRPESETMIDLLKSLRLPAQYTLADIGTGSGALAITAALELPQRPVYATDIDQHCLELADANAKVYNVPIHTSRGDLVDALPSSLDSQPLVLLCNLPYVPTSFVINAAAAHEPQLAIYGGEDGLDLFRRLFRQLSVRRHNKTYVLCESLPPQHEALAAIAHSADYDLLDGQDFIQVFLSRDE